MGRMRPSRGLAGALRRYRFEALALTFAGAALATGFAVAKPKTYRSTTRLLAEPAHGDSSGGQAKVEAIESEILSQSTLDDVQCKLQLARPVSELLGSTGVEYTSRDDGKFEIEISHEADSAEEAKKVVAHLSGGYQANVYERPVRDQSARVEGLEKKAVATTEAFEAIDARVRSYEEENADYLEQGEEQLTAVREAIEDLETRQISDLTAKHAEQTRLIREEQPFKQRKYVGFDKKKAAALERRLQAARSEIRQLMEANQWPEDHPDLVERDKAADAVERELQAVLADKQQRVEEIPNPMYDSLRESIATLESQLEVAKRKLGAQRREEQRLLENARLAPDIRKKHAGLVAERDAARAEMEEAVAARDAGTAKLAELKSARALRFSTMKDPSLPQKPAGTNPAVLALIGLLAGGAAGVAMAMSRDGMDKSFRQVEAVHAFLGVPTLGAIGPIRTPEDEARAAAESKRQRLILISLAALAVVGLGLALTGADAMLHDLIAGRTG